MAAAWATAAPRPPRAWPSPHSRRPAAQPACLVLTPLPPLLFRPFLSAALHLPPSLAARPRPSLRARARRSSPSPSPATRSACHRAASSLSCCSSLLAAQARLPARHARRPPGSPRPSPRPAPLAMGRRSLRFLSLRRSERRGGLGSRPLRRPAPGILFDQLLEALDALVRRLELGFDRIQLLLEPGRAPLGTLGAVSPPWRARPPRWPRAPARAPDPSTPPSRTETIRSALWCSAESRTDCYVHALDHLPVDAVEDLASSPELRRQRPCQMVLRPLAHRIAAAATAAATAAAIASTIAIGRLPPEHPARLNLHRRALRALARAAVLSPWLKRLVGFL